MTIKLEAAAASKGAVEVEIAGEREGMAGEDRQRSWGADRIRTAGARTKICISEL